MGGMGVVALLPGCVESSLGHPARLGAAWAVVWRGARAPESRPLAVGKGLGGCIRASLVLEVGQVLPC